MTERQRHIFTETVSSKRQRYLVTEKPRDIYAWRQRDRKTQGDIQTKRKITSYTRGVYYFLS